MLWKLLVTIMMLVSPFHDYLRSLSRIPNRVVVIAMDGVREKEAYPEFQKYIASMSDKGFQAFWQGEQQNCRTSQPHNVSLPAYATMFSGFAQEDINDNSFEGTLTVRTVFDAYQRSQLFSAWSPILKVMSNDQDIREKRGFISGRDGLPFDEDRLIMKTFFDNRVLSNRFTFVHLGDGDNYAHAYRWQSYLKAVKYEAKYAMKIIDTIERDVSRNTFYFVVSDHGRGESEKNWGQHARTW
jgi:hypothetical protein